MKKCPACGSAKTIITPISGSLLQSLCVSLLPMKKLPRGRYMIKCQQCEYESLLIVEF